MSAFYPYSSNKPAMAFIRDEDGDWIPYDEYNDKRLTNGEITPEEYDQDEMFLSMFRKVQ